MEIIALFFPAVVSVRGKYRENLKNTRLTEVVCYYASAAMASNIICMLVINSIFSADGVTADALNSFSFFIKYVILACIVSWLLPIIEKYIRLYISIKVKRDIDK